MQRRAKVINFITRLCVLDGGSSDLTENINLKSFVDDLEAAFTQYKKYRVKREELERGLVLAHKPGVRKAYINEQDKMLKTILASPEEAGLEKAEAIKALFFDESTEVPEEFSVFLQGVVADGMESVSQEELAKKVTKISLRAKAGGFDFAAKHIATIEGVYQRTAMLVNEQAANIGAAAIRYYNGLNVAYKAYTREQKISPNPPNSELHALQRLDKRYCWLIEEQCGQKVTSVVVDEDVTAAERWNKEISHPESRNRPMSDDALVDQICALLDYAKIKPQVLPAKAVLKASSKKELTVEIKKLPVDDLVDEQDIDDVSMLKYKDDLLPGDRTNALNDLVTVMARHLFLFFFCYPEVAKERGCFLDEGNPDYRLLDSIAIKFAKRIFSNWGLPAEKYFSYLYMFKKHFVNYMRGNGHPVKKFLKEKIGELGLTPEKTGGRVFEAEVLSFDLADPEYVPLESGQNLMSTVEALPRISGGTTIFNSSASTPEESLNKGSSYGS